MTRDQFRAFLHDALSNIHDYVVLEKHPFNDLLPRPEPGVTRAENLRRFIWEGIEALKPKNTRLPATSLEWRYYRILSGRYIEGASVAEIQKLLALGDRQERRLHGRAFTALANVLWDRLSLEESPGDVKSPANPEAGVFSPLTGPYSATNSAARTASASAIAMAVGSAETAGSAQEQSSYPVTLEPLHLAKVLNDTTALLLPQLQARGGDLSIHLPANLPMVQADRIILRQILLHLFNRILQNWAGEEVFIQAKSQANLAANPGSQSVALEILSLVSPVQGTPIQAALEADLFSNRLAAYWVERLKARLSVDIVEEPEPDVPEPAVPIHIRYTLELPAADQARVLVVDDHEPAIRIIQRYLSQTNIQAVGVTDPTQLLALALSLRPRAILLDVMMPAMDGWEILQKLKADPETQNIPVIICSVWEQPDLAFSLGANGFLKKPISQADLLAELARSHLLDISDEPLPGDA